jgi:hypothetical protein
MRSTEKPRSRARLMNRSMKTSLHPSPHGTSTSGYGTSNIRERTPGTAKTIRSFTMRCWTIVPSLRGFAMLLMRVSIAALGVLP